jgi:hypothetical protein
MNRTGSFQNRNPFRIDMIHGCGCLSGLCTHPHPPAETRTGKAPDIAGPSLFFLDFTLCPKIIY